MSFGGCPSWVAENRGRKEGYNSGYNSGYQSGINEMEGKLKKEINKKLGKKFLISFKEKAKEEIMKNYKEEKKELLREEKEKLTKRLEKEIRNEVYEELEKKMLKELSEKIKEEKNNFDFKTAKTRQELDDEYKELRDKVEIRVKEQINKELSEEFKQELEKFKTQIKNKENIIFLPNLKIIVDYINYDYQGNVENYVADKFKNMGYKVKNTTHFKYGHPDLICENGLNRFYVEVKSPKDSLRLSQAKWILHNKNKEVILYFLDYESNAPEDLLE